MTTHHLGKVPTPTGHYIFVSGSDMDPTRVNATYPGAQFIARAWVEARQGEIAPAFGKAVAPSGYGETWGILLHVPDAPAGDAKPRTATTDDGRVFDATLIGDRLLMGEPAEMVAAARYWELPPIFVNRLAHALEVAVQADGS